MKPFLLNLVPTLFAHAMIPRLGCYHDNAQQSAKESYQVTRAIVLKVIAIGGLLFQSVAFAEGPNRPKVWIYTDMSDPSLTGANHRGTINDPDDVSSMAGYLLMADRFETLGIVVASTHRKEHATTPDQAAWAKRLFGEAYKADVVGLKQSSANYPDDISFVQSCIKESAEKFVDGNRYDSLDRYKTVKALFDTASQLKDNELIYVLCWGSLTEPAILVAHCLANNQEKVLKKLRFIGHWTSSPLHQGTPEHPERVANCQEDAAACRYMKLIAGSGTIFYYECGAIGQHGIVSGSPKGKEYFDDFRTSRLGTLFVDGKYVFNCVDHSDSATYWVLLGEYGVSLKDISADGSNLAQVEKANEAKFAAGSKRIHDELLRRSMIAATSVEKVAPRAIEAIDLLYSGKIDWNKESGAVTFLSSGHMPDTKEGFFWKVPPSVKQIVINPDVTVEGAFRVTFRDAKNPLFITGRDRKTSVIAGSPQQKWTENAGIAESDKWRYGAINVVEDAIVHISNLTSRNPRGYNISGYANKAVIHVDSCDLLDTRGGDNNNSDGFIGAAGSSIRNSLISTSDDAIKVYHDIKIENVTIEQHRNGAPLQFGWGGENDVATATIKNLVIRGVSTDDKYNLAPITWLGGQHGVRNVSIDGLTIDLQGEIYNQANKSWQPIGLMLVKPSQCTLNLEVKRAKMGDLPLGLNAAKGSVRIEPSVDSQGELPRSTASDKVVIPVTRPNVIVILTDDLGWSDLGCQGSRKDVLTPHIDSLASRGVRCTAAYVTAPQCSPSRAGLITGRHQQRFGIDTIPDMPLPSEAVTIAERLQPLGYRTGFVGKWHLEPNATCDNWIKRELPKMAGKPRAQVRIPWDMIRPYSPAAQGFQEYFWGELQNYRVNYELDGHEADLSELDGVDAAKDPDETGSLTKSTTQMKQVQNKDFRLDVETQAAIGFIERNHAAPFYLQLNYYGPHTPLEATEKYLARFPTDMPIRRRYALAAIAAIDDGIGRVVEKLNEHGVLDNTLIVVTSDNGAPLKMTKPDSPIHGDGGGWNGSLNEPWVGEKGMLSEGGIRVPMIWSLPSRLPSGKTYDLPVSTLDIAPSVLQLAGGDIAEVMLDNMQKFDGINLIPAMNGMEVPPARSLYFRFWDQAAIRSEKWKYIYVGNGRRYLFDLESDQHEHKNLIDNSPEVAGKLHQDLVEWCEGLLPAGLPKGEKMRERSWYNFYFDGVPVQK